MKKQILAIALSAFSIPAIADKHFFSFGYAPTAKGKSLEGYKFEDTSYFTWIQIISA